MLQLFPAYENRNQENCKIISNFCFLDSNYCEFLKSKVGLNTLPMSRVCHNRSFSDEFLTLDSKLGTRVMALSRFPIDFITELGNLGLVFM